MLRRGTGTKKTPEEAKDMVELAVNVVHAFATLLPDAGENAVLVARTPGLVRVLPEWWVISFVPGERGM